MTNTSSKNNEESLKEKPKKSLRYRIKIFSMQYLAHHPICKKFDNHIFRIGPFIFCVGCSGVLLGFLLYTVLFFSMFEIFKEKPIISGLLATFGVIMALIQISLKPENKWLKFVFRICLGIGLGGYTSVIILVAGLDYAIGSYTILVQIALFLLLIPGVYLYNILRGESPYLECKECDEKFLEPTCDYNTIHHYDS